MCLSVYLVYLPFYLLYIIHHVLTEKEYAVEIANGTFTWSREPAEGEKEEEEEGGDGGNTDTGAPTLSE